MSSLLRRKISLPLKCRLDRTEDVPKMLRLSDKTGEVFCAASCTFGPTKGMYNLLLHHFADFNFRANRGR